MEEFCTLNISDLRDQPQWLTEVAQWQHQLWLESLGVKISHDQSREDLKRRRENLHSHVSNGTFPVSFIAHFNENPVGSLSLVIYQNLKTSVDSYWLTNFFVKELFRKQGIGTQLLAYAREYTQLHGVSALNLCTMSPQFYLSRGWENRGVANLNKRNMDVLWCDLSV